MENETSVTEELLPGQVVALSVARSEVDRWADFKRLIGKRRDDVEENLQNLASLIAYGTLSIDDDMNIIHKLIFPIGDNGAVTELKYKSRLTTEALNVRMKGIKAAEVDARLLGYTSALTNRSVAILNMMDIEDKRIAEAIATFFV